MPHAGLKFFKKYFNGWTEFDVDATMGVAVGEQHGPYQYGVLLCLFQNEDGESFFACKKLEHLTDEDGLVF